MYLQKVKQKNLVKKNSFLLASWRSMTKIAGFGSISQRHGSADPDPDPHQNVMDPQNCFQICQTMAVLKWTCPKEQSNYNKRCWWVQFCGDESDFWPGAAMRRGRVPELGILLLAFQIFRNVGVANIPPVTLLAILLQVANRTSLASGSERPGRIQNKNNSRLTRTRYITLMWIVWRKFS